MYLQIEKHDEEYRDGEYLWKASDHRGPDC